MEPIKRILLVEDDPKDIELTLTALSEYKPANEVVKPVRFTQFVEAVKQVGVFGALIDEPPGSMMRH